MPEQDAEEEDVRTEEQAWVEQGLGEGERMTSTASVSPYVNHGVRASDTAALYSRILLTKICLGERQSEPDQ
jgi:hypothetical protein